MVLGLLFNYCFFDKQVGISFFIYIALLLFVLFGLFGFLKVDYNKAVWWYLPPILFFSAMIGIRDSMFLMFWNFVVTVSLLFLMTSHIAGKSLKDYLLFDYIKTAVMLPFFVIAKGFDALGRMLTVGKGLKENQKSSQIIKGIVITLPFLVLFLVLLSSADLVFNRLVSNLFSFNINPSTAVQVFLVLFFTFIWIGSYVYILEKSVTKPDNRAIVKPAEYKFGNIEAGILLGTLNFLFLVFVIIQIKYLFAGQSAITNLGFTYAEYTHKGFAEMIFTALLSFGLIFGVEKYIEKKENSHAGFFKFLSGLMIVLLLVIMSSAFMRLNLYEQAYGFTLLRLLVQGFILWLAVIFLWLGYKIMFMANEYTFTFGIFFSVIVFFFIFNLLNPDAFIAQKNIGQFAKQGKLDTLYLSELSADAVPEISSLLNTTGTKDKYGKNLSKTAAEILMADKEKYSKYQKSWQSHNYSRKAALVFINENLETITNLTQ